MPTKPAFTKQDDAVIREYYGRLETKHLAERLGHNASSIHGRARKLGLAIRHFQPWTDEEDELLSRDFPDQGSAAVAKQLRRSETDVKRRASQLGVKKRANASPWRNVKFQM